MHRIVCRIIWIAEWSLPHPKSAGSLSDLAHFLEPGGTIPYLIEINRITIKLPADNFMNNNCSSRNLQGINRSLSLRRSGNS